MKRKLQIIMTLVLILTSLQAYSGNSPVRDIKKQNDGYQITYTFNGNPLNLIAPEEKIYSAQIDGFNVSSEEGMPCYLYRNDTFVFPKDFEIDVSLVSVETEEIKGRLKLNEADDSLITKDEISEFLPSNIVEIDKENYYRGLRLPMIKVCPIQYNAESETIIIYKKITYELTYRDCSGNLNRSEEFTPYIDRNDAILSNNTLNFEDLFTFVSKGSKVVPKGDESFPVDYLIVTTNDLLPAAETLAEWRRQLGMNVTIFSDVSWPSANKLKLKIKEHYGENPSLYYLMILGDGYKVPGFAFSYYNANNNGLNRAYVDIDYALISGGMIPDFYRGRIPAYSLKEANDAVNKIIDYEKNPCMESSFYNRGIITSSFVDECHETKNAPTGYEKEHFLYDCEEIRDHVISTGFDLQRCYTLYEKDYKPTNYNRKEPGNGKSLPKDLLDENIWKTSKDLKDMIETGVSYVLFHHHSTSTQWGPVGLDTSDLYYYKNKRKLPLIFSLGCKTGMYYYDDEAENISIASEGVLVPDAGACAVIAPTGRSFDYINASLAKCFLQSIYSNINFTNFMEGAGLPSDKTKKTVNKLGHILDNGLIKLWEVYKNSNYKIAELVASTYRIVIAAGDPAMQVYTATPYVFKGVSHRTTKQNSTMGSFYLVSVNVNDEVEDLKITCYDKVTGRITSVGSSSATFNYISSLENTIITVTGKNCIPYYFNPQGMLIGGFSAPAKKKEHISLFREDLVWEYAKRVTDFSHSWDNPDVEYTGCIRTKFNGTTIINGKEYHRYVAIYSYSKDRTLTAGTNDHENWNPSMIEYIEPFQDYNEVPLAYIREEDGRYFMLRAPLGNHPIIGLYPYFYGSEINESLIYDFNLEAGSIINQLEGLDEEARSYEIENNPLAFPCMKHDYFNGHCDRHEYWKNCISQSYISTLRKAGFMYMSDEDLDKERLFQETDRGVFIEGLGLIYDCMIAFPGGKSSCKPVYSGVSSTDFFGLTNVFNADGKNIMDKYLFGSETKTGIDEVKSHKFNAKYFNGSLYAEGIPGFGTDAEVFDITGRKISVLHTDDGLMNENLSFLVPGIYIVEIKSGDCVEKMKIAVK